MRIFLYIIIGLLTLMASKIEAQNRYITSDSHVTFFSKAPLQDIKASSDELGAILDVKTGETIAKVRIRSFDFKINLMEEHFNENFMESETYPEAEFRGKIQDIEALGSKQNSKTNFPIEGKITIHGVTRPLKDTVNLNYNTSSIEGEATFYLKPEDFNIEIPSILTKKIAEEVKVTIKIDMKPHK